MKLPKIPKKCIKYSLILCLICIIIYVNSNKIENYTDAQIKAFKKEDKITTMNDDGQGNVAFLDRHKVECDGLISQFRLVRSKDGKKYHYKYKCLNRDNNHKLIKDKAKQTNKITPTGKSLDIVGKEINCYDPKNKDKGIVSFLYKNEGGKAFYDYTCGSIVPKTVAELKKEKEQAEKVKLTLSNGNRVRFLSFHKGKYIRGLNTGKTTHGGAGKEEVFRLKSLKDNKWALFNESHKRFLKVDNNTITLSPQKSNYNDIPENWDAERFVIVDAGQGKVGLKSVKSNKWVGMSDKGALYQAHEGKDLVKEKWMTWERFEMIPISKQDNKHFDDVAAKEKKAREDKEKKINDSKPKTPGCYVYANEGKHDAKCKGVTDGTWKRDKYGELNKGTFFDEKKCKARAKDFKTYCKSNVDWRTHYNKYNDNHTKPYAIDSPAELKKGPGKYGNTVYLDGHDVNCGTHKFIKKINLKNLGDKYTYLYKCN